MDPVIYTLFDRNEIILIKNKLEKILLNSANQGKSNHTLFEMFKFKKEHGVVYNLFSVFDIFVQQDVFNKSQEPFLNLKQLVIETTSFYYNNMKLLTQNEKQSCKKFIDEDYIISNEYLNLLSEVRDVDVSQFSCRDDLKKGKLTEIRVHLHEQLPIYVSFIHDHIIDKYFYKFWFPIQDDIDDILLCLGV